MSWRDVVAHPEKARMETQKLIWSFDHISNQQRLTRGFKISHTALTSGECEGQKHMMRKLQASVRCLASKKHSSTGSTASTFHLS